MSAKTPNSWHARFITVFLDEKCQYDLYGRRQFSVYSLTEFLKATHVLLINNILKKKKKNTHNLVNSLNSLLNAQMKYFAPQMS